MDDPEISEAAQEAYSVVLTLGAVAIAVVAALLVAVVLRLVVGRIGRRSDVARDMSVRMRRPTRTVLLVLAVLVAVQVTVPRDGTGLWWRAPLVHLLDIGLIAAGAWLVGSVAFVLEDRLLVRFSSENTSDDRHARRARTQIVVVRRLTVAILVVCAIAGILMTFPAARAAGASILASAGLISIVAGLAAQTSLANVFAGMQIAFTDAIRSDDVVVLEGEWGRIEEITMTYVVVHLWDDRRLILPSTYFTTTPFENWTRRQSELLGTVEVDLDWEVPVGRMRGALKALLAESGLWDERVGILQVTEATGGRVQVRALVSAADAPTLFDLRCYVREGLVDWLQREAPQALPRVRFSEEPGREPVGAATTGAVGTTTGATPTGATATGTTATGTTAAGAAASGGSPTGPDDLDAEDRPGGATSDGDAHGAPGAGGDGQDGPRFDLSGATGRKGKGRKRGPVRVPRLHRGADGAVDVPPVPAVVPVDAAAMPTPSDDATVVMEEVSTASESALFSGTREGIERSRAFSGPGQEVWDEREETAIRNAEDPHGDAHPRGDGHSHGDVHPRGDGSGHGHEDGRAGGDARDAPEGSTSEETPDETPHETPHETPDERARRAPRGGDPTGSSDGGDGGSGDGGGGDY
ncbi:small-conductance mechanosensitive channel [Sediminihabitans luteus]|uniref:Small-conductance mechanosensitive channel n=1 Tax=Sediminihabitans luteus TaxID=1138585 RepID=A0A2M9D078_9CELL|nr:mechanosensitive ion channel domain-containing protein [Sediminihabitans luteus]PJJ77591.1 small-conductance mechanosensitive channel [Sediminihabitans luteus]GII98491.1 hypothetical protein Slu03_08690 [Sediminihabitans luteus]